ncbi:MAG: hypothetical protein FJW32_00010 [Acidobacteria bacterium]|nr:hypothetical protein [Acidobacteriota bacterium]
MEFDLAALESNPALPELAGEFWASGFGADRVPVDVARKLVERGAPLSIHAAAAFGFVDHVAAMLARDPALVHAKGGDGCTPLHFARNVRTTELLLAAGAAIDARDDDHDSTPAQWRIDKAPDVVRHLLDRGASPDLFLAAALGDLELAERLIDDEPACVAQWIGRPSDRNAPGGTIYQWTLGFNSFAHQIALRKGHQEVFDLLVLRSDPQTLLLVNCVLARRAETFAIAREHPHLVAELPDAELELLARYCWETNSDMEAVRLMLDLGFPIAHVESRHGYSPLHNAAWKGNADLVDLLLQRGHPVDLIDPKYEATALDYAIHDCVRERRHPEGEFARVAELLLQAGCAYHASSYPSGDERLDAVLAGYR